jgi:hypothetical protein
VRWWCSGAAYTSGVHPTPNVGFFAPADSNVRAWVALASPGPTSILLSVRFEYRLREWRSRGHHPRLWRVRRPGLDERMEFTGAGKVGHI